MEKIYFDSCKEHFHKKGFSSLKTYILYRTSGVIFFHRLLHSYTRHIEGGSRGERDIVPSTQD